MNDSKMIPNFEIVKKVVNFHCTETLRHVNKFPDKLNTTYLVKLYSIDINKKRLEKLQKESLNNVTSDDVKAYHSFNYAVDIKNQFVTHIIMGLINKFTGTKHLNKSDFIDWINSVHHDIIKQLDDVKLMTIQSSNTIN